jgi:RND superfamily putative drug exporter
MPDAAPWAEQDADEENDAPMSEVTPRSRWSPSWMIQWYAHVVVFLRWFVVAFWVVATAVAVLSLPTLGRAGGDLNDLVSMSNPAIQSELRSYKSFGFPLLSRVAVVQRNPHGLPIEVQTRALARARAVSEGVYPDMKPVVAAVPVLNTLKLFPGSREDSTTIITLLFTSPDVNIADQAAAAQRFVANHYGPDDAVVGVTGSVPARVEQGKIVLASIPWLELVTIAAVFLIVAVAFRSLIAPLIALGVAGVAIVLTLHIGGAVAERLGVPVPQETQPLLVALVLGVVTDYVVFYLSTVRAQLAAGHGRLDAARHATARFTPIIATAGATAAAGTGALIVSTSPAFRAFGPGMALAVLIGMVVAVTLVPATLAILGRVALWSPRGRAPVAPAGAPPANPASDEAPVEAMPGERSGRVWARVLTWPLFSAGMLVACVAGLVVAALPMRHLALGVSYVDALPADHPARKAANQAETGFATGILSPTELLVQGSGLSSRHAELARLQESLSRVPGVAAVVGSIGGAVPQETRLFETSDGSAVRYLLILADEPLGARAIHTVSVLQRELPGLLANAGLTGVTTSLGGDTAVAKTVVDQTTGDLGRIAAAALLANLLFLMLFMRALVVPAGLLACSVLAIAATLGLTTWLFQDVLGHDGLTFYVPIAAAVLLVALGSDYNIFGVGPAWKEARGRPLREALALTLPQSSRAIRTAAFTLAVSFGLLALVPLRPFRELAFALAAGVFIDAFIVRSLLAPSLLTVMESLSALPTRQLVRQATYRPRRSG